VQVRLIFRPVSDDKEITGDHYICHQYFSPSLKHVSNGKPVPEPASGMLVFKRMLDDLGRRCGDIARLSDVQRVIDLSAMLGNEAANRAYTPDNVMELHDTFYLNHFATKDIFDATTDMRS